MTPKYGLTYKVIDGHSQITSVITTTGEEVKIEYTDGKPNFDKLTDVQLDIIMDCQQWLTEEWEKRPGLIIRETRKGLRRANKALGKRR